MTNLLPEKHGFDRNLSELAYIIGALRDGCFTRKRENYIYRIRVYQKDKAWILQLAKKFQQLFDKKPAIEFDNRKNVFNLRLDSKKIYEGLTKLAEYPGNQKRWKTPKWILKSPQRIQKEYVKGFFDAEGGVPHVEKRKIEPTNIRIHFSQGNKKSLIELKKIINSFGVKTGSICGPYFKKNYKDPQYVLMIHGIKEVTKFYHIFGSLHSLKIKRLNIIRKMME